MSNNGDKSVNRYMVTCVQNVIDVIDFLLVSTSESLNTMGFISATTFSQFED